MRRVQIYTVSRVVVQGVRIYTMQEVTVQKVRLDIVSGSLVYRLQSYRTKSRDIQLSE